MYISHVQYACAWMDGWKHKFHFHRCRVQSFHLHVQLPALSSQVDVIHSLCASLNGLDMSLDSYKYNHSSLTIKCTVLRFRLMFFIYIEKNAWAAFPFSVVFSFPFSFIFLFFIIAYPLCLGCCLFSVTNTKVHFAIFTRQLFVRAQLDFIAFFHPAPHWKQIHMQCSVEPCTVTHKLLQVWVALLSLRQNRASSLDHIYQGLI